MLLLFYRLPLIYVVLFMYALILLWTLGIHLFGADRNGDTHSKRTQKWRYINAVLVIGTVILAFYATVLNRSEPLRVLHLQPFRLFEIAKENPEMYRSMLMNVALFVPMGVTFSSVFSYKTHLHKIVLYTVLFGMCCSMLIEIAQYIFALGETEIDDVICNTFGALLGALPPVIQRLYTDKLK